VTAGLVGLAALGVVPLRGHASTYLAGGSAIAALTGLPQFAGPHVARGGLLAVGATLALARSSAWFAEEPLPSRSRRHVRVEVAA
jgi:hypothetical protein